jgi:chromosome segregation ATPase
MEAEGIAGIIAGISGLVTGGFGGIKWVKSQQLEEVTKLINEYQAIHKINKEDLADIRSELERSKEAEQKCFEQHREAMHRIDELDRGIRSLTNIPPKPKKGNG